MKASGIVKRKIWDVGGDCTSESAFLSRRRFMGRTLSAAGIASLGTIGACADEPADGKTTREAELEKTLNPRSGNLFVKGKRNPKFDVERAITDERVAAGYNNFYEFTTSKTGVWSLARDLTLRPWTVEVTGEVAKPLTLDVDDIVRKMPIEERLYRFRCVEAWAMTVPWTGFPFKAFLDLARPTSRAKYVRFVTFHRPHEAPGQRPGGAYQWPYYEALTIEEASNELTLMANGIYGHEMPRQHGAPLRIVVPWKYGYKSIKSIVRIELTENRPPTFWNDAVPLEYGFWSNVNPRKPHPRWSQATERLIGTQQRVATLPYNGYAEFVHHLYKGTPNAAL